MSENAIDKIKRAERKVEAVRRERAELEGRRKQLMERLKTEFDVNTLEQAKELLMELEADRDAKAKDLDEALGNLDGMMEKFL